MATRKKTVQKEMQAQEPAAEYMSQPLNFDKVWLMFQETDRQFKETDKKFKETDKKFKETEKLLNEKFQETDRLSKETDQKIKALSELFTSQWGKLIESLVEGAVVRLLNSAGIGVYYTVERVKGCVNGENFEFDIIALDGDVLVAVEVKTTLRPTDVKAFLKKMARFRVYLPNFSQPTVMGCMAFLRADSGAEAQAQNAGLYVIKATNDSATLLNGKGFKAKVF
jgi:hypothetical protein